MKKLFLILALAALSYSAASQFDLLDFGQTQAAIDIDQAEMLEKLDNSDAVLIDIRTDGEVAAGAIPGSVHLPISLISQDPSVLDQYAGRDLIFYCKSGGRVKRITSQLSESEHADRLFHLKGDYSAWVEAKRPVVVPSQSTY